MTYQILMIEDDEQICEVVKDYFTRESENEIVVRTAQNGQDGLDLFETAICREMRRTSMVPILFLTARISERDILLGYDLGCDDYIIKPFSLVTLYAKCKALIRRSKDISRTGELVCGRIHMKPSEYRVLVDSQEIELAPKEFALLRMLLENKNKTVARERLLIGVWGYDYDGSDRCVDNHIRKIRKHLGSAGKQIKTVIGNGYQIRGDDDEKEQKQ